MRPGGEDLLRQFNKGMDYAQNTFNIAEGVTSFAPTLIFKGVVIDVDFEVSKSTTTAALLPPFSVFAKIIGMDESSADPLEETDKEEADRGRRDTERRSWRKKGHVTP